MQTNQSPVTPQTLALRILTRFQNLRYEVPSKSSYLEDVDDLKADDIICVVEACGQLLKQQSSLLHLSAPIKVVGDLCGKFSDLLRIFQYQGYPKVSSYLFLGNYIGNTRHDMETVLLLFSLKILYPQKIYLLAGKKEFQRMERNFFNLCLQFNDKKNPLASNKLVEKFQDAFSELPIAAQIGEKIFCIHGGIFQDLKISDLADIKKQLKLANTKQNKQALTNKIKQLLTFGYQQGLKGWGSQDNTDTKQYGTDVLEQFLKKEQLEMMVCSRYCRQGYSINVSETFITLFSAPASKDTLNSAAILSVSPSFECTIYVLKPSLKRQPSSGLQLPKQAKQISE